MPLNFEQAAIQQPKIDIIGKEVPLEALEKTGNILQDRYDKSYEQYSMADEALKQMESSANPIDREKAKELRAIYNTEMKGIVDQGDFHNMRHQTAGLARNAAMNYKIIADRNAEIQKGIAAIQNDPKFFRDKDKRVADYLAQQKSIGFNADTRTITDANVNAWTGVANVNDEKLGLSYGTVMKPITIGGETGVIKYKDAAGNMSDSPSPGGSAWHIVNGRVTKELKPEQIAAAVGEALRNDPELNADINQDLGYEFRDGKYKGIDPNSPEGQAIRQQHINARISKAANSAGNLLRQHEVQTSHDETIAAGGDNMFSGAGIPPDNPFNLMSIPNEIISKDEVEGIDKLTTTVVNQGFNEDGSWKGYDNKFINDLKVGVQMMARGFHPLAGPEAGKGVADFIFGNVSSAKNFDELVPKWKQDIYKAQNPKATPKDMFIEQQKEMRQNAKVLTSDYIIGGKGDRGTSDANFEALIKNNPFYKPGNGDKAQADEIAAAWKSGGITMNPYKGTITIGTGDSALTTVLGNTNGKGEGNDNNHYQVRMKAAQNVIQSALSATDAITQEGIEVPQYNPRTGQQEPSIRYRLIKPQVVIQNGKKYMSPQKIVGLKTNPDGTSSVDEGKVYDNMNDFVNQMLTEVVGPSMLK